MLPAVFILILHCAFAAGNQFLSWNSPEPRRLSAGALSSRLKAREESAPILLKQSTSFDYFVGVPEEESVFATTLDVESQWPILALEDLDAGFDNVICTDSQVQLSFVSATGEQDFEDAIRETPEFVVVTSHEGCDSEGDRSAHRVTSASFDPGNHIVTMEKVSMDWHSAFSATRVSFSRRHPSEIQKRGSIPAKRQATPTESFPPGPTNTKGLNSSASTSFDVHHTGLEIYPVDSPLANEVVPQLPVVVKCKTCTLQGDIQLSKGQFSIGESKNDSDFQLDEAMGFFKNGSVELSIKQLFSQIELELELSSEGPLLELSTALPTIGLSPFQIAGVITFGPLIVPEIIVTADLEGDVGFSYGFNVTVPDDSRVLIKVPSFNESKITGFEDTKFETIPFEASTEVTSVALSLAFQPKILLGMNTGLDALNVRLDGGIGAFVSLPNLSLNVSKAIGVNEDCESVPSADDHVGNATRLVPSIELDMGIIASYDVQIGPFNDSRGVSPVLASTSWDLPAGCIGFQPEKAKAGFGNAGGNGQKDAGNDGENTATISGSDITFMSAMLLATMASLYDWS
ncbi:hypothetical protein BDV18DRAFT_157706 [Aspergillus unguis]